MDRTTATWVTFANGVAAAAFVRRCRLRVVAGPDNGNERVIESERIRIGARSSCDLRLADPKVSGLHCEIVLEADGYRLHDLGSTNGTWVSGLRIHDAMIPPGTTIVAGESWISFEPLDDAIEIPLWPDDRFGSLVGASPIMRRLFARLARIAQSDVTVLVTGETGSGKELVAEAIHDRSSRAGGPLVVLDASAIPPNLAEAELFGHERGAFTGAMTARPGAFERAHGGTLFLDEIGELPLELQPKLLRALERREIRRIGGSQTIPVDIRVVAATNRNVAVEVSRGRFREDLYYRLAVAEVRVPPLRERREDIPRLVEHFVATLGNRAEPLRSDTIALLMQHDWPGNVRELRNVIERAALLRELPSADAPLGDVPRGAAAAAGPLEGGDQVQVRIDIAIPFKEAKESLLDDFERRYVTKLLDHHNGNLAAAARAAGVDRMAIHKILQRRGLKPR